MKIIVLSLFILLSAGSFAQIWKYPYSIMGIERNSMEHPYKMPSKVVVIDSSYHDFFRNYSEYDKNNRLIKKAEGNDTILYQYDEFGYEILRIIQSTNDSVRTIIERTKDHKILKKTTLIKGKPNVTSYEYDKKGRITAVYSNGKLYDKLIYDKKSLISVENYYHQDGGLSQILNYSYNGDTVTYEECPYDEKGKRYDWPCEKTVGVLNNQGNVEKIIYTYLNFNDGKYEKTSSTTSMSYDKSGKILSISDLLSNGSNSEVNYFYNASGTMDRIEIYNDGTLVGLTTFIVLEK